MRRQRDQNISENIGRHKIISLCSDFLLHLLIVDKISQNHLKLSRVHTVRSQIVLNCRRRAGIKICSDSTLDAEHQRQDSEDAAPGPHIQHHCLGCQVLADLADAELRRLVHAGPECRTGIDMKDKRRLFVRDFRLLPRGNRKNVVDPELMEILLPVVDPVQILGLLYSDCSIADVAIGPHLRKLLFDRSLDFFRCPGLIVYEDMPILSLLKEEAQDCCPVIFTCFGQDVHEHLLLLRRREWYMILNLCAIEADVLHGADHDVFRINICTHLKTHPFHIVFSI